MDEQTVAEVVEERLTDDGWEVFKEVPAPNRNKVVDLYATKGVPDNPRDSYAIEAKSTCSIRVIQQADFWRRHAHRAAIAVPVSNNRDERDFAARICGKFGLGMIEVDSNEVRFTQRAKKSGMGTDLPSLYEAQKEAVAGTDDPSDRHTELDRTLARLEEYAEKHGLSRLDAAIEAIGHHYSSDASAERSIKKHIRDGKTNLAIRWRGAYLIEPKDKTS